jgi:ketosteroid isomerase-like protein
MLTGICILSIIAFVLTWLPVALFAQFAEADSVRDRIEIQEKLLYAYAYTYESKDCEGWSNLFTTDAVLDLGPVKASGRDAIRQGCIALQRNVVGNIKTRHNMMNIVFDQLTPRRAQTRTYLILTWQKPGDQTITVQATGTYRDVTVKSDDGRWLFEERKLEDVIYTTTPTTLNR